MGIETIGTKGIVVTIMFSSHSLLKPISGFVLIFFPFFLKKIGKTREKSGLPLGGRGAREVKDVDSSVPKSLCIFPLSTLVLKFYSSFHKKYISTRLTVFYKIINFFHPS